VRAFINLYAVVADWFHRDGWSPPATLGTFGSSPIVRRAIHSASATQLSMVTLRVVRHDRHEQVLAECQSTVLPDRGEVLQLDTIDASGEMTRPSTLWRVVSVTVHIPSIASARSPNGAPPSVKTVEVTVLPDISLVPEFAAAAEQILSESKM
jgi:hypothetical protein